MCMKCGNDIFCYCGQNIQKDTTVSESPSVTGYLALAEGDIIKVGDEWQTAGDTPEWLIVEEGDINIGKKYLPGTYMTMRRAR